jgi:hypothetical protein
MLLVIQAKLSAIAGVITLLLYPEHELWDVTVQTTVNMAPTCNSDTRHFSYDGHGCLIMEFDVDVNLLQLIKCPLNIKCKNLTTRFSNYACRT